MPAVSTIWRILTRRGFVTPQPQKRPRSSWKSFCADQPNERWQADITHGRLADGTEVEILNILDDHSRVCIASTARLIFTGTQVWQVFCAAFGRWGIPAEVLTDNGAVFTGKQRGQGRVALEVQLGLRGIRVSHSRPYHPQTCGKVERFHQTLKKWLRAQPRADQPGRAATPAEPVRRLLQHHPAAPGAAPPHPRPGLRRPTESRPHRPDHPRPLPGPDRPDRPRRRVTLRHNSRLHHIGLGARLAGTPITLLIDDLHIRVIHRYTGDLIRELTLDPTRDYQPRGYPPAHRNDRSHTPPGIPIPAQTRRPQPGSRLAAGHPQGPGLDPGEDGATITSRDAETPRKCNDVPRHLPTVSRDITCGAARGLEPLTCCL